ncbi:TPA: hypothetical protein PIP00_002099 [Klebsiella pneumoniae]|nr:hypothetical protein [Klebsiella pneumoniae subsp. ozaenae]HDH0767794.1 hypothetical protein [Klebsiella pneumoniae]
MSLQPTLKNTNEISMMNTKEPNQRKIPEGTFQTGQKEPVIARIAELVGRYPSRRQAAQAWGINYSTLQNYFKRADDQPTPRKGVLEAIALHEGVSVEWLLTGIGDEARERTHGKAHNEFSVNATNNDLTKISELLKLLRSDEVAMLANIMGRKGAEIVLYLLDEGNIKLLQLPQVVKDQILAAHSDDSSHVVADDKKVCASTEEKDTTEDRLAAKHKQAS